MHPQFNTEEEIWKVVPEFPTYIASNLGRIKKAHSMIGSAGNPRKPRLNPVSGYYEILFCENYKKTMRRLHRVIAQTFIGPIPSKMEVNHKDGDPSNNRAENLEIVTSSENKFHAYRVLGRKHSFKTALTDQQVREAREWIALKIPNADIAKLFKVETKVIRDLKNGRTYNGLSY